MHDRTAIHELHELHEILEPVIRNVLTLLREAVFFRR